MLKMNFAQAFTRLLAVAVVAVAPMYAVTYNPQVVTAGSSAQWGVFAEAAYELAKADGNAHHYTIKGGAKTCGSTGNGGCVFLHDTRTSNILDESGNIWIVWSATSGRAWAYISVDSTVGVRAFSAFPRARLGFVAQSALPSAGSNALAVWDDKSSDSALDPNLYSVLQGHPLTAANTDIRPEDALGATERALAALNTSNYDGLGYAGPNSGCPGVSYLSEVSTSNGPTATPVNFALSGTDPCSHQAIPAANQFRTIPAGAAPIIIIANRSNTATGHLGNSSVNNVTHANLARLFDGTQCDADLVGGTFSVPVTVIQREPLSGTMNTFEFTNIRLAGTPADSQEKGVNGTSGSFNPLNMFCSSGGGKRIRGIGTGDVVKGVNGNTDSLGYVFFSYEALIPGTGNNAANVKYLKLDGVDPLATSASSTYTGNLPACGSSAAFSCPITPTLTGANSSITSGSFYTLRAGTYRSWSVYRVISDGNGSDFANAQTLVSQADRVAFTTLPDFVPFGAICSSSPLHDDPGLSVYREHFETWTDGRLVSSTENDGPTPAQVHCTTGGARTLTARTYGGFSTTENESGGDVGGTIIYTPPQSSPLPVPSTHVGGHQ